MPGASQNQPKGNALPSLIIGEQMLISEHIQAASCVNPTADLINRAIRPEIKRVVFSCLNAPERIIQKRAEAGVSSLI